MFELNCDAKVMKGIAKILEKCKDNLTTTTTKNLTSFSYNLSNFYGLPKINKFKVIQKGTKEQQKKHVHITEPSGLRLKPISWLFLFEKPIM